MTEGVISTSEEETSKRYDRVLNENSTNPLVFSQEPDAKELFVLESSEIDSFLTSIQNLGFDTNVIGSKPKGGVERNAVHDNIPLLEQILDKEIETPRRKKGLLSKVPSKEIIKHGRFHIRIYSDKENMYITGHIDPPNLEHLNVIKHLRNNVEVDYEGGTDLLERVLKYIYNNQDI